MSKHLLPCIACGATLGPVVPDELESVNQPYGGTVFSSHGQYGSTVFDEMGRERLEITVCDKCLVKKAAEGKVLHYTIVSYERPVYDVQPWAGPYRNENNDENVPETGIA